MKERIFAKTIASPSTEQLLGEALLATGEKFYLIYRIVIETGISYKALFELKVKDIPNPPSFPHYIHIDGTNNRPLSSDLEKRILKYIDGRDEEEYFIYSFKNRRKKFNKSTFYTTFKKVLCNFHLENEYSPISLRKTYAYHIFLEVKDPFVMRRLLKFNSIERVYDYFGIELPPYLQKKRIFLEVEKNTLEYQLFLLNKTEEQAAELSHCLHTFLQTMQTAPTPLTQQNMLDGKDELLQDIDALLSTCLKKVKALTQAEI